MPTLALSPMLLLGIVIAFSFVITSIFMFKPKGNETVHIIFFWLAVALNVLVTFISATSLPDGYMREAIIAWCGLIVSAVGIVIRIGKGKTSIIANIFVMTSTVYGVLGYFLLGYRIGKEDRTQ